MKTKLSVVLVAIAGQFIYSLPTKACTGITLKSKGETTIVARTIEWGGSNLNSQYVIVPRGHTEQSYTPDGMNGMTFTSRYGYVGFAVEQKDFVAEGLNEVGLSAGLFYFPNYGKYQDYDFTEKEKSISDLQLVSWILGKYKTVDEVKEAVKKVRIINIDLRASTVHWRFTDTSGHQLVLEIINGVPEFYENKFPGTVPAQHLGNIELSSFGAGSGFLGIPGDVTPPSRFVRAAFYQTSAPQQDTPLKTVLQCFQILNNFDIPVGIEFKPEEVPCDIPSATQWTSATDMTNRIIYFRTMYNSAIRSIDLNTIDFTKVHYQAKPMDIAKQQPVETIKIK